MPKSSLFLTLFMLAAGSAALAQNPTPPFTQCAPAGQDGSCRILIVIGANGGQRILTDNNVPSTYDGADDTLIGVINLSSNPVSSIPLVSNTQIMGFDGDGICDVGVITPNPPGCPFGPTHYEGPGVTFTNINANQTAGLVNFNPAIPPNGGTGYFSLEMAIPTSCPDADGDGLCDDWERNGLTVNVNGVSVFVDLPSMGANPNHKDIFIQADYMQSSNFFCVPVLGCVFGHTHKPNMTALSLVTQAFASAPVANPDGTTGITLHVDCGSDCIMNPITNQTWGALSKAVSIPEQVNLGTAPGNNYDWTAFDTLKTPNFIPTGRQQAFHYLVLGHNLGGLDGTSGISRGIGASDYLVTLGSWTNQIGTVLEQGGTIMHELGHNLNLQHGGTDGINYKPNYLSIMNYIFQTTGLTFMNAQGKLDYSRFALGSLNEGALNETAGLNGGATIANYGTAYFCVGAAMSTIVNNANGNIDWNCNGNAAQIAVATDINQDGGRSVLTTANDWQNIVFNGGAIGGLGLSLTPPQLTTAIQEITPAINAQITKPYAVAVGTPGIAQMLAGTSTTLTFTISNTGAQNDTYTLTPGSTVAWGTLTGVPATLTLAAGANTQISIPVAVPAGTAAGSSGSFSIKAVSTASPAIMDVGTATISVAAIIITSTPTGGQAGAAYAPVQLTASGGSSPYTYSAAGLPPGLSLSTGGQITGTPTVPGAYTPTVTITDASTRITRTQPFSVTIASGVVVLIGGATPPNGQVNSTYGPVGLSASGGTAPYIWGAVNLPPGLNINLISAVISGTPAASGTYTVTVAATDSNGIQGTQVFNVTIAPAAQSSGISISPRSLSAGSPGVSYGPVNFTGSGGSAPYTFSASGLPTGLTLTSGGVLSGTPAVSGVFTFSVTATDATSASGTQSFSLTVSSVVVSLVPQTISFTPVPDHVETDAPFTISASASSGLPVTFTVVGGRATVSGNTVTLTGLGPVTLMASQPGNSVYDSASATVTFNVTVGGPSISSVVNAASLKPGPIAPGSFASIFGTNLGSITTAGDDRSAQSLGGSTVTLTDSAGAAFKANLSFVSYSQINFVVPSGMAGGAATLTVTNLIGKTTSTTVTIAITAPAIFTADSTGSGIAAAEVLTIKPDGTTTVTNAYYCFFGPCTAVPITVTGGNRVYLVLFGTGMANVGDLTRVSATVGSTAGNVTYAGPQGSFPGLDQVNILLPSTLAGSGPANVTLTVNGTAANTVKVSFQ